MFNGPIDNYHYFYITPTGNYTSAQAVRRDGTSIQGVRSESANTEALISGEFFKHGFVRVNEVRPETAAQTLIVNFGEVLNDEGFFTQTEIVIQLVSADTQQLVCSSKMQVNNVNEARNFKLAII